MPCGSDKRRHTRYSLHTDIMLRLRERIDQPFQRGTTENISLGGMLCQIEQPVELEKPLQVILHLPDNGQDLHLEAHAVRFAKDTETGRSLYLGLAFDLKSVEEEKALQSLMDDVMKGLLQVQ